MVTSCAELCSRRPKELHIGLRAGGENAARALSVIEKIEFAMLFKLFRKPADSRPRFEQDAVLAEALERRVSAIAFQPSKGFLKDRQQPKRSPRPPSWSQK